MNPSPTCEDSSSASQSHVPAFLIDHALSLIAQQKLPTRAPNVVAAGFGKNEDCRLCGRRIEPAQVQYEATDENGEAIDQLKFHLACYSAWEAATRGK